MTSTSTSLRSSSTSYKPPNCHHMKVFCNCTEKDLVISDLHQLTDAITKCRENVNTLKEQHQKYELWLSTEDVKLKEIIKIKKQALEYLATLDTHSS